MTLHDLHRSPHLARRRRRLLGVLPLDRALELDEQGRAAAARAGWLLPIAGADEGDGDGDDGGSGGDGDGDGGDGGSGDGDGDQGSGDGDGGDTGGGDTVAKAEHDALKRRLADETKKRKQLERDAAKRKQAADAESGEFKKLYEEEKERSAALESKLRDGARDRAIVDAATRLKFRNPQKAILLIKDSLPDDVVDDDGDVDTAAIEKALKAELKSEPYLAADTEKHQGGDAGRGDAGGRRNGGRNGDRQYKFDPRGKLAGAYTDTGDG